MWMWKRSTPQCPIRWNREAAGPGTSDRQARSCIWPDLCMLQQIGTHLAICMNERMHGFGVNDLLLPCGCGSDQRLNVQFVGIEKQPDQGHLIVRLVANVADDDDARTASEVIDVCVRDWTGSIRRSRKHQRNENHKTIAKKRT